MIWSVAGIVGCIIGYLNLRESQKTIDALRKLNGKHYLQYNTMQILGYGHYRNDLFRLAKHGVVLLIGVIAMVLPSPNPHEPVTPLGVAVSVGFCTIVGLLILASALDRRQYEIMEREENGKRH